MPNACVTSCASELASGSWLIATFTPRPTVDMPLIPDDT
jgi:hypothetical protein